jgi:hypothetical protein
MSARAELVFQWTSIKGTKFRIVRRHDRSEEWAYQLEHCQFDSVGGECWRSHHNSSTPGEYDYKELPRAVYLAVLEGRKRSLRSVP